jgi:hypothetical protein
LQFQIFTKKQRKFSAVSNIFTLKSIYKYFELLLIYTEVVEDLYNYHNPVNKRHEPILSKQTRDIIIKNSDVIILKKV